MTRALGCLPDTLCDFCMASSWARLSAESSRNEFFAAISSNSESMTENLTPALLRILRRILLVEASMMSTETAREMLLICVGSIVDNFPQSGVVKKWLML